MTPDAAAQLDVPRGNAIAIDPRSRGIETVATDAYRALIWPVLMMGAFGLLAIAIVGPMFAARLGAVDDHEIPFIGGLLRAQGPIATWLTFAGEADGRFRPFYWTLRLGEITTWGENVGGWYVDRAVLLLVTLVGSYVLARRWFSTAIALLVAVLVVAGPQAEAFYRLGPQEAYAMPLTVVGLALIGRRRFGLGLGLLCLAALTKEPFVLAAAVGVAWTWWLGARRPAVIAGLITLGIGLAIARAVIVNGGDYYTAQGLTIGLQGRYLFPAVIAVALAVGTVLTRTRWLALPVLLAIAVLGVAASRGAIAWSAETRAFAGVVDELRADPRPLVVSVRDASASEPALAIRRYLPDRAIALVPSGLLGPWAGFATTIEPGCLEVDVQTRPGGLCPEAVAVP